MGWRALNKFDSDALRWCERRAAALLVGNDVFFNSHRDQILDLAARTAWFVQ
jgi:hypothetical protein